MRKYLRFHLIVPMILILLIGCQETPKSTTSDIMYFILIDRFVDGDTSNNRGVNPDSYRPYDGSDLEALKYYQGGDLVGVTQSLDSLRALGITMIWISPFIDNSNTDYVGWWPYHGYHPIDFFSVDEHYGTLDDLKELVSEAHSREMKVIFDMPFNQTAADHPWIDDPEKKSWYHLDENGEPYAITSWFDQEQIEIGELHGLPDLAQENPAVSEYLFDVSRYWIEETGCDGFRLDAVKHVPAAFWEDYTRRIKELAGPDFLLLGEVFWGDAWRIKPYADLGFDHLFDIPGYYAIRNTFNKGASLGDFSKFYELNARDLPGTSFATLIDNHDVARFNVDLEENAWEKQLLALGWLMTSPGLPVIYSGTEIGMKGYRVDDSAGESQDFLNRLPYPAELNQEEVGRKRQFAELTELRNNFPALSHGSFVEIYKDWSIYSFLRSYENEHLLVCINNAGTQEFISTSLHAGVRVHHLERKYGTGAVRLEEDELLFRLPPNSMTVWQFEGRVDGQAPQWTSFTDRLSADYEIKRLFFIDKDNSVEQLQLAGDFNNWTATDYPLERIGDSLFIDLPVKRGSYLYKFVINGDQWMGDPNAAEFTLDPYGGKNSILKVE